MTIIKITSAGICSVLLAMSLRQVKSEYGVYIAICAGLIIGWYAISMASQIVSYVNDIASIISDANGYIMILLKIAGISYLTEFASDICKDCGYQSVASQIEFASKLVILCMSIPIMTSLINLIDGISI